MPMELDAAVELLSRTPEAPLDVAEIALRLARDEFPGIDVEAHLGELVSMAHEARRYMRGNLDKQVAGLCLTKASMNRRRAATLECGSDSSRLGT